MKKRLLYIIILISFFGIFQSCDMIFNVASGILGGAQNIIESGPTNAIKQAAYERAEYYVQQSTRYKLGTSGRSIPFDCSGLVERCYEEALKLTPTKLPFTIYTDRHPSAQDLYNKYTNHFDKYSLPSRGDLVFLDYERLESTSHITHVGIVDGVDKNGIIYFIDASNYEKYKKVVDYRTINRTDKAVIAFGEFNLVPR